MAGPATKGSRLPLQKSLSRRVSFKEDSLHRRDDSDEEAQSSGRAGGCSSICNTCCFWISIILGLLLFALILLGSMYFAFLKSNLPNVRFQRLDANTIDVISANKDTLLTADLAVLLNATTGNGKGDLIYSEMTGSMTSAGIDFGEIKLEDVTQPPHSTTTLKVAAAIKNVAVEYAAAKELQENWNRRTLVVDVAVAGKIDRVVEGKKMESMPFKIECSRIEQWEIESGHAPKCTVELTPIR